jgi:hypothetical protein
MLRLICLCLLCFSAAPCALSQKTIHMDVATDVLLVVTDPAGKKTGIDSRFSRPYSEWIELKEIPHSVIGFETDDETLPSFTHFEGVVNSPMGDGDFTIEIIGQRTGVTWLSVIMFPSQKDSGTQEADIEIHNIPVEKDSVVSYRFTYHSPIGSPASLIKVVSA